VNAILNYLYALLEAEARIAALAVGLDPGLGVYHTDQKNRDSLACDIMEPVRPQVDSFVLDLLKTHTFAARDFFETREGMCRVLPPFTHLLADTVPKWAEAVAPVAEHVAQMLLSYGTKLQRPRFQLSTPLTQAKRNAGRDRVRRQPKQAVQRKDMDLPDACKNCGVLLDKPHRLYCDECLPQLRRQYSASLAAAGPAGLASLRAQGQDPAHGGEAARKRGEKIAQQKRDAAQWEQQHQAEPDPAYFKQNVLPLLQGVSLLTIARATGLSLDYCSKIRRGLRVPHERYWQTMHELASSK
jgi:hypothetical protein